MSALDLPPPNVMLPPADPDIAQAQGQARRLAAQQAEMRQQQQQLQHQALQNREATNAALGQTMAADAAQWSQLPVYQKDWQHQAPEYKQHMIDAYGPVANQLPAATNAAARAATGNPDIGIPPTPAGSLETRRVNDKGEVERTYVHDTSLDNPATAGDPLSALSPQERDIAQQISEYRFPYNALSRMPPQQRLRVLNAVGVINPDFDSNQYPTRQGVMKSFSSGPDAANIASARTLVGHLNDFLKAGEALHNKSFTPYNAVANAIESATGNPAQTAFDSKRNAVADELAKLFKGTGAATDAEIKSWKANLSGNASPEQIHASAQSAMELMASRLDALREKYQGAMGKEPDRPFLGPREQAILRTHGLTVPNSAGQQEEPQQAPAAPITVNSQAEYDALPSGASYVDSHGKSATKK